MKWKAFYATFVLAVQLLKHLVRRFIFKRPSPGLQTFLHNYRDDGIPAMTAAEKDLLYRISSCVSCRLCDSLCPAVKAGKEQATQHAFMGPAFYPASASRLIPDYPYANLDLELCSQCSGCESICPHDVPIRKTFELMRQKVESIAAL